LKSDKKPLSFKLFLSKGGTTLNKRFFLLSALLALVGIFALSCAAKGPLKKAHGKKRVSVQGDWIYVDGERFFVKGVGYSPGYPQELPWKRTYNEPRLRKDFEMIKAAGFNTIRTWSPMTPQEIDLAGEYGLFVMQGIWVNYTGNFASEENLVRVMNTLYEEIEKTKDKDNILLYLLGNEPLPTQLFTSGLKEVEEFFLKLRDSIKKTFPDKLVSIANWVQSDFLDTRIWDVICLNLYSYAPESVSHSLGFAGYAEWTKKTQAVNKPLILSETGLSVSPTGRGAKGYGGNTVEEQRDGLLNSYSQAIDAGATGVCVFEFMDEWWKNYDNGEDHMTHENADPEEWFGIVYFDDQKGVLVGRPAYDALLEYNKALIISPKTSAKYTQSFPVEVYVGEEVDTVEYKIGEAEWKKLEKISPHWMQAAFDIASLQDGKYALDIRAWQKIKDDEKEPFEKTHKIVCEKREEFFIDRANTMPTPFTLTLNCKNDICYTQGTMTTLQVICEVKDAKGNPVQDKEVTYSITEALGYQSLRTAKKTDKNGQAEISYFVNEPDIISIAAGTEKIDSSFPGLKTGDIRHISVYYNEIAKFRIMKNEGAAAAPAEDKKESKPEAPAADKAKGNGPENKAEDKQ
jgi:hypothetical protein